MRFAVLAVAVAVAPLAPAPAAAADGARIAPDTLKAFRQLDEVGEQLARARAAMAALEAGEKPRGAAGDWSGAGGALVAAADALRRSSGLTAVPDPEGYAVPTRPLRACATRAEALARLERSDKALQAAQQRGGEVRGLLRDRLGSAQTMEDARRYLVKASAKLAGDPRLAEYFTWRWSELEGPMSAAVAVYGSELRRLLERVERSNGELRALAAEQAGLAASFAAARDCLLAGAWSGTRSQAGGAVSGLSLQLTSAGDSWTGTASVDGASVPVRSVTVSGNAVTIVIADGKGSLTGTLSQDGRAYKGTFSSIEGPGPFSLRRQ